MKKPKSVQTDEVLLPTHQAALAGGLSPEALAFRRRTKGMRCVTGPKKSRLYSRAQVISLVGRDIPLETWQRAAKSEGSVEVLKENTLRDQLLPYDVGWVSQFVRQRDTEWQRYLVARDIIVEGPAFDPTLLPDLESQQVFGVEDVAILQDKIIEKRDRQWEHWIYDTHERAAYPGGPPKIGSEAFDQIPRKFMEKSK